MQRKKKKGTGSDFNSSVENCSGYLLMKRIIHKRRIYVKAWCSLEKQFLTIYKGKNETCLEDINIEVSKIIPIFKEKSKYFSFQINNGWNKYIFVCKIENEYREWMNKLKLIESSNKSKTNINQNSLKRYVLKQYIRDERKSSFHNTNKLDSSKQNEYLNNNKINNPVTYPQKTKPLPLTIDSNVPINESDTKMYYEFDSSKEICKGYLWIKTICDKEIMYVKLWCTLTIKTLGVYEEKDGKHLQDINIGESKISLVNKRGSNNFYFRIIYDKTEYTFGTRAGKEYEEWINKLQSVSININS